MSPLSLVSLTLIGKGIFPEPPKLQTLNLLYAKYVLCYELPPSLTLLILQLLCLMFLSPHLYPWEKQCLYLHEFILHLIFNQAKKKMCYSRTLVYMIECKAWGKHSAHQNIQNICIESAIRTYLVKCSCLLSHAKYLCLILLRNFKGFMS